MLMGTLVWGAGSAARLNDVNLVTLGLPGHLPKQKQGKRGTAATTAGPYHRGEDLEPSAIDTKDLGSCNATFTIRTIDGGHVNEAGFVFDRFRQNTAEVLKSSL